MSNHIGFLVFLMLVAGIFGGIVNYLLLHGTDLSASWKKSIGLGVLASFLVPLFLQTISSDLLKAAQSDPIQYLPFLGFCLVAAVSSTRFVKSLSDRILREAEAAKREAGEAKELAKAVVDAQAEPVEATDSSELQGKLSSLSDPEHRVLGAMLDPKYRLRSVDGIASEVSLPRESVTEIAAGLVEKGLAKEFRGKDRMLFGTAVRLGRSTSGVRSAAQSLAGTSAKLTGGDVTGVPKITLPGPTGSDH